MEYSIDWKLLGIYITIIAGLALGAYFTVFNDSGSEGLEIQVSNVQPGEVNQVKVMEGSEPVEDAGVYLNEEFIGSTGSEGVQSFRVPENDFDIAVEYEEQEVERSFTVDADSSNDSNQEGSDSEEGDQQEGQQDEEQNQDNQDKEEQNTTEDGDEQSQTDDEQDNQDATESYLELLSEPKAGQTNRVVALEDGKRASDLQVVINGEVEGETDNRGEVRFVVPNTEKLNIEVESLGNKSFSVSGVTADNFVNLESPASGKSFSANPGETTGVNFAFETPSISTYSLYVGDQQVSQSEGGEITETRQLSEGSHQWYVESEIDGEVQASNIRSFEVVETGTEIEIIEEGTETDYDEAVITFRIQGEASEYRVLVNGEEQVHDSVSSTDSYSQEFSNHGDQVFTVEALNNGEVAESVKRTLTTTEMPQAQIRWLYSNSFDTTTPKIDYEIDVNEAYDYSLEITDSQGDLHGESGSASGTQSFSYTSDPLPQGTHNYNITAEYDNEKIGESTGTFETTAERALVEGDFSYQFSNQGSQHQILMDMKAYEDLEYNISVDGDQRVNEEFTGSTTTRAEDIGSLNSGQSYTATIEFGSLGSSKTREETVDFTAQ